MDRNKGERRSVASIAHNNIWDEGEGSLNSLNKPNTNTVLWCKEVWALRRETGDKRLRAMSEYDNKDEAAI